MKWGLVRRADDYNRVVDPFRWDIDRFFDDFFSSKPLSTGEWNPRVDVAEDEKSIQVTAEIPGLTENDIKVTIEKNVLTISGEKKEEKEEKDEKKNTVLSERRYGSFCRSMALPEGIKADAVSAEFKNGVLKIALPKEEAAQPKRIEVKVH
ncbi:MAG: Hsp20/alpha crystallin family protein [Spirochaetes bacterium]|nr:Hsp20/alpha crystallin family protein [Spirochaetota bacterium]